MSNILVINASGQETRVALIEQGTISEYYLERKNEKGIVGNIYKGKVVRVLPGMQAAFVDIGLDRAAFLHVEDLVPPKDFDTWNALKKHIHQKRFLAFVHAREDAASAGIFSQPGLHTTD